MTVTEEHVSVDLALSIKYGYSIPAVCSQVQEKVSAAIENMTGLVVLDVNIRVAGVNMNEADTFFVVFMERVCYNVTGNCSERAAARKRELCVQGEKT